LKWLIGELGPARDWDVFLSDVLGVVIRGHPEDPDLAMLREAAEARRDECYETAQAAIRARRYTALLLRLGAWVEGRGWRNASRPEDAAALYEPVEQLADVLLRKRHKKVRREGKGFESMASEERHALRIQIKKLRYASEFLGSLYPRKRVTRFVGALRDLQDGLGLLNDLAVACRLMAELTVGARGKRAARLHFASGLIAGWHTHLIEARERNMVKAWKAFAAQTPFWR